MNGFDDEKGRLGRDVRMKERESGVGIIGWLSGAKDGCMETGVEMEDYSTTRHFRDQRILRIMMERHSCIPRLECWRT